MDPAVVHLCELRGYVTRPEMLALGITDKQITSWVRTAYVVRVRRGAYCLAESWQRMDVARQFLARSRAVQQQADATAALSHVSALTAFGIEGWDLPRDSVHLTRFDGRAGRREAGVVQHRGALLVDDLTVRHGVWVTSATRTALDLTTLVDLDRSVAAIDALLHAGETTVPLLAHRHAGMSTWPGTLRTRMILRLVDPRSESVGESLTRLACRREGLAAPELQFEVEDAGRVVAKLDLAWPRHKVWVEFDGREKYLKHRRPGESVADAVLREKRREEMIRRLTGWSCVRISWNDLAYPSRIAAAIRAAMAPSAA